MAVGGPLPIWMHRFHLMLRKVGCRCGNQFHQALLLAHVQGAPEATQCFQPDKSGLAVWATEKKLLKTVALAAQATIETGELPGEAIEGICRKPPLLNVAPKAYAIEGERILGTIQDLLTNDVNVLLA